MGSWKVLDGVRLCISEEEFNSFVSEEENWWADGKEEEEEASCWRFTARWLKFGSDFRLEFTFSLWRHGILSLL